ncbi:MAG: UDP-N-acetylglucosamine 1-carboxyvinyltransferase [Synergistaceae bacterium]|nr:UDP-N-acetylglucosamine 1-carboxyvinyltransferase [Synergistaceae bacterium]
MGMNEERKLADKMLVRGGKPLNGTVDIQGAKNAALPIMAASILLRGQRLTLDGVPNLYDIQTMRRLLCHLGAEISFDKHRMVIDVPEEIKCETPVELVRQMRASSLALGPLVARCGRALLPLPGGCVLGSRPLDFHLKGLAKMGAEIELKGGAVTATAGRLKGANITLDFPSVGATENLMMAAALAEGVTFIENAAKEPEISNLAEILRLMGAPVKGDGTETIRVTGVERLHSAAGEIIPDRIEAATYLMAGVITNGSVTVRGIPAGIMDAVLGKLQEAGVEIDIFNDEICAKCAGPLKGVTVRTLPYPGFPTDTQPQMMAVLTLADGTSVIHESVFDSRLLHINEFKKLGAKIELQDNVAIVTGVKKLAGTEVHSSNLRAGAALILLGLAAEEETLVCDLQHVWRGYEGLVEKLRSLGAEIEIEAVE